jgi:hypothetical protein
MEVQEIYCSTSGEDVDRQADAPPPAEQASLPPTNSYQATVNYFGPLCTTCKWMPWVSNVLCHLFQEVETVDYIFLRLHAHAEYCGDCVSTAVWHISPLWEKISDSYSWWDIQSYTNVNISANFTSRCLMIKWSYVRSPMWSHTIYYIWNI